MVKKQTKKDMTCAPGGGFCHCKALLAIVIVVLIWVSTAIWSKVIITIAAAIILLSGHHCCHNMNIKKK